MFLEVLLFVPCVLKDIIQFITSRIESRKLQMLIAQYSLLTDLELWISYRTWDDAFYNEW